MFLTNVLLALAWVALTGSSLGTGFPLGFLLGYGLLWLARPLHGSSGYLKRVPRVVEFTLYFAREVVVSTARVTYDVLTPTHHMRPGIIALPLDARTDTEILILSSLITLTPGSLSLDLSPDRKILYVHEMYIRDAEQERQRLKNGLEKRLLEILR
jgi:multicomponent Na+:H+ antiporter subunit E